MQCSSELKRFIKKLRKDRSQRWLATAIGIPLEDLQDLEMGCIPSDEALEALLDYVDWDRSIDEFLDKYC